MVSYLGGGVLLVGSIHGETEAKEAAENLQRMGQPLNKA